MYFLWLFVLNLNHFWLIWFKLQTEVLSSLKFIMEIGTEFSADPGTSHLGWSGSMLPWKMFDFERLRIAIFSNFIPRPISLNYVKRKKGIIEMTLGTRLYFQHSEGVLTFNRCIFTY